MKLFFKMVLSLVLLLVAAAGGFAAYLHFTGVPKYPVRTIDLKVESTPERVARGKLISEMLCKECHFDAATGRLTGQRMADVPKELGAAYSKNITQDPQHGIGAWSDGEIAYLLRTGIRKDGTYTPPWMVKLPRLADEDIHSIIAFLRSGDSLVQAAPVADRESEPTLLASGTLPHSGP